MKTGFFIRNKNTNKETTIVFVVRFGKNDKVVLSTKFRVKPFYWDEVKQRVSAEHLYSELINEELDRIQKSYADFDIKHRVKGAEVTKEMCKQFFFDYEKQKRYLVANSNDFIAYLDAFCNNVAKRENKSGVKVTISTSKQYLYMKRAIVRFSVSEKRKFTFDDINQQWHNEFKEFLESEHKSINTIRDYVRVLKVVLKSAEKDNLYKGDFSGFVSSRVEIDAIYLNISELQRIAKAILPKRNLNEVRDLFLVSSFTGLRYSDLITLDKSCICQSHNGINIRKRQEKTGNLVEIPVFPIVEKILIKYDYVLPFVNNVQCNRCIKVICRIAGINDICKKDIIKGGERHTVVFKKWELVSMHTARRSFATNMFLTLKVPAHYIMKMTGHKTEQSFMSYIRATAEDVANEVRNMLSNINDFFTEQ